MATRSFHVGFFVAGAAGAAAFLPWILVAARPPSVHGHVVPPVFSVAEIPPVTANIPYADAKPILDALRDSLPASLKAINPIAAAWPDWVSRHNEEIRERLERGDEDSIINFWYYGTSFTTLPPLSVRNIGALHGDLRSMERIVQGRLEDLIAGILEPGTNERLRFARAVIDRKIHDPTTAQGKDAVRRYFSELRSRIFAERDNRNRTVQSTRAANDPSVGVANSFTVFRDRGLSSDTSIVSSFTIQGALEHFKASSVPGIRSIRRVGIVGPGLDFTDKVDGYDFYPLQTIQPFAVIDSLVRLGFSKSDNLQVTTFDLSPRINRHIEIARQRARAGEPYTLQLPLDRDVRWNPALVAYWRGLGGRIGEDVKAIAAPREVGNVSVRAVKVRPDIVMSITGQNLNVVLERLQPLPIGEQFDLIIATNVLIYYDIFEQNLALANVASMLRPGGLFLSNSRVFPAIPLQLMDDYFKVSHTDRQIDYLFWYQRQ